MFNKHFRKYIFKYSLYLIIGILVLIIIDYVQLEIPKNIGTIVNMLDEASVTRELKKIDEIKDYELGFIYNDNSIYWYKDYLNDEAYKEKLLITSNELSILENLSNVTVLYENGKLYYIQEGIDNFNEIVELKVLITIIEDKYTDNLNKVIIMLVYIILIVAVGRFLWRIMIFGTSRKIEYGLRNEMFRHATTLSQDYYSHQKVGGMMTYFINDLNAIRMAFGPGIMMLIDSVFLGFFTLFRMFKLNVNLTLIILVPVIALVFGMILINKSMRRQFRIRQEKFRDLSDYTQENFSGLAVIKAYVREAYEVMTFKRLSKELYDTNVKFFKKSLYLEIITGLTINIIVIAIIGFGSYAVIAGSAVGFNIGELTEYISLFFALSWPTRALARFLSLNSQAQASAQRITEFLETKPTVYDKDPLEVNEIIPRIEATNLSFKYPDSDVLVLDNLNFTIEAGEMVGILGKTGSGKTTLVDLLLRVYNVPNNQLTLGYYDIMYLPINQVRNIIGYVPQDNFLFSDTIKANIAFSKDFMSDDEITDSSKLADIHDNVNEFKEGYNTILGERGVTVSGGQKQRISIARAIAKNPEILILDDSVSAVDTKTEETIINNLHKIRKGKTTIFIAHRISTVKDLDKIILIDDGKIVGIGSHHELLKNSDLYQEIVKKQTLEEKVQGGNF